jgi:hypothetical protein
LKRAAIQSGTGEPGSRGTATVRNSKQETTSGDSSRLKPLVCALVICKLWSMSIGTIIKRNYELCDKVVNKSNIQSKNPSRQYKFMAEMAFLLRVLEAPGI